MLRRVVVCCATVSCLCSLSNAVVAEDASTNEGTQLEEIIVTAQKRSERIQDVPVMVTVLDGNELTKAEPQSLGDLAGYVPGLTVTNSGVPGQTQLTLRGIATDSDGLGALVGTYVDDVQVGFSSTAGHGSLLSMDLLPYDIDRLEVLSGPQGTLYGAGAMGGLLKYVFRDPQMNVFDGRAGATTNYIDGSNNVGGGVRAAVNIPLISDELAIRLSGFDQRTQGFIDNIALGNSHWNPYTQQGGRFVALWLPNDNVSVKISALGQNTFSNGDSLIAVDPTTLQPQAGPFKTPFGDVTNSITQFRLYSVDIDWNMGFASLTSTSSWQKYYAFNNYNFTPLLSAFVDSLPGGPFPGNTEPYPNFDKLTAKVTEEVRLTSPTSQRFEWMLGAFYTHETTFNRQDIYAFDASGNGIPSANPLQIFHLPWDYEEEAAFANGTYKFTDRFDIAAGARYAENHQTSEATAYGYFLGSLSPPAVPDSIALSQGVFTWMVSPEWHFDKDTMLYARLATGYRPGGYSYALNPGVPTVFASDKLTNYEVGLKTLLLNGGLSLDMSLYDIEWKNIQVNLITYIDGEGFAYFGNGASARSQGGELGVKYAITKNLEAGLTLAYVDARLTAPAPSIGGVDGAHLPYSSRVSGSLRVDYRHPAPKNAIFEVGASYRYSDNEWYSVSSTSGASQVRPAQPVDAYAGLEWSRLEARVFLKNAFNSEPRIVQVVDPAAIGGPIYLPLVQPRTVGLSVDLKF